MTILRFLPMMLVAVACSGGGGRPAPLVPKPMSFEAHMRKAAEHERAAGAHAQAAETAKAAPANHTCVTSPELEQTTSGGERITNTVGCTDISRETRERHEREANEQRAQAARHRAMARMLVEAERTACAGLSVDATSETPFARREEVAAVTPIDEGVRIELAGGRRGAEGVRREIACHRARAATLGHDPSYMPYDPTVLPATRVTVEGDGGKVVVTVRAADEASAGVVRTRARALRE